MASNEQKAYQEAQRNIEECRKQGAQGKLLDLGALQLAKLPLQIGQLTSLTQLYLSVNQLTTLLPEINKLTALKKLYLHDNPALQLPEDILGATWEDVCLRRATPTAPRKILDPLLYQRG